MNPEPTNTRERTAHELWCEALRNGLSAALDPAQPVKQSTRIANALQFANHFENTRLRVVMDETIKLLEASSNRCAEIAAEHKAAPWWRPRYARILQRQHQDQLIKQQAYQDAVLILCNTPPPMAKPEDAEPNMKVQKGGSDE